MSSFNSIVDWLDYRYKYIVGLRLLLRSGFRT